MYTRTGPLSHIQVPPPQTPFKSFTQDSRGYIQYTVAVLIIVSDLAVNYTTGKLVIILVEEHISTAYLLGKACRSQPSLAVHSIL